MKDGRVVAQELVDSLHRQFGTRMECAILYGSWARGEAIPGVSDVNVMVLLDDLHSGTLAQVAPIARRWAKEGHSPPLIMERRQWARSSDVFAIELADMRDAHVALHGADCVAGVPIAPGDLRAQAESELRGKLLQLQRGLVMAEGDPRLLGQLLQKALPSFVTYLRAVIRLSRTSVPGHTAQVIRDGLRIVGGTPDAMLNILESRTRKQALRLTLSDPVVEQYHTAVEQTADWVDNLREVGE